MTLTGDNYAKKGKKRKVVKGQTVYVEKDEYVPTPPQLPKQERAPWINIETSIFGEELGKLLDNDYEHDIIFEVDNRQIYGHKLVVVSGSNYFRKVIYAHERDVDNEIVNILEADEEYEDKKTIDPSPPKKRSPPKERVVQNLDDIEDDPEEFCCPITQDLMEDPVIAEDGNTYERTAIVEWIDKHGDSPISREPLNKEILIINRALKNQIEQYKEKKVKKEKKEKEEEIVPEKEEEKNEEEKPKKKEKG